MLNLSDKKFDERMKKLADPIRHANEDGEGIQVTGGKITQQFQRIEAAELEDKPTADNVVRLADERKS